MTSIYKPKVHYICTGLQYQKPKMRLFSLNEHDEWTMWRSNSDYFYPEMIPEPDYSDYSEMIPEPDYGDYPEIIPEPDYSVSGDDARSEDDEYTASKKRSRLATERLRDVTEVHVANTDVKVKKATLPKMTSGKQVSSFEKQAPKSHTGETTERQSRKMSPKTLPKAPKKNRSKSPTKVSKSASPTPRTTKPREGAKKKTVKPKSPPPKIVVTDDSKRAKSPDKAKKRPTRSKSPSKTSDSKSKPTSERTRSPEGVKKGAAKTKPPSKPTAPEKAKVSKRKPIEDAESHSSKEKTPLTETKPSAAVTEGQTADSSKMLSPPSPTAEESKSSISSAISSEEELIRPKKPYQHSTEKQKLHKELKFSQRYGKLVSHKTELQLAIERFTENKERRVRETGKKTSLEKILDNQARKIKMQEATDTSPSWMDHLQRPPSTLPKPKTDEFYRVHARVVSNNPLMHCFLSDDDKSESS